MLGVQAMNNALLQEKAVLTVQELTALGIASRSKIYVMMNDGTFPKPLKYGRCNRWRVSDVRLWLDNQAEQANKQG